MSRRTVPPRASAQQRLKAFAVGAAATVFLAGCAQQPAQSKPASLPEALTEACAAGTAEFSQLPRYWPRGTFSFGAYPEWWGAGVPTDSARAAQDDNLQSRYALTLCAMLEAPMSGAALADATTMRFLQMPSFTEPVAVLINGRGDRAELVTIKLEAPEGVPPGMVRSRTGRPLSPPEWSQTQALLDDPSFWSLSSSPFVLEDAQDGARWLLEVRIGDRYHVVQRQMGLGGSPEFEALGRHILALTDLQVGR